MGLEYDFRQAYGAESVTAREVAHLADRMRRERSLEKKYRLFYAVSAPGDITEQSFPTYRCAIAH